MILSRAVKVGGQRLRRGASGMNELASALCALLLGGLVALTACSAPPLAKTAAGARAKARPALPASAADPEAEAAPGAPRAHYMVRKPSAGPFGRYEETSGPPLESSGVAQLAPGTVGFGDYRSETLKAIKALAQQHSSRVVPVLLRLLDSSRDRDLFRLVTELADRRSVPALLVTVCIACAKVHPDGTGTLANAAPIASAAAIASTIRTEIVPSPDASMSPSDAGAVAASEARRVLPAAVATSSSCRYPSDPQAVSVSGAPLVDADRSVAQLRAGFRTCYSSGLTSDPDSQGRIVLVMKVAPDGRVIGTKTTMVRASRFAANVLECVRAHAAAGTFTPYEGSQIAIVSTTITLVHQ